MLAGRALRKPLGNPSISRANMRRRSQFTNPSPSTIDTGFILSLPKLPNPATSDPAYDRVLSWYLPAAVLADVRPRLAAFGEEAVSPQINDWISNAEREQPYVKTRSVWGSKYAYDRLVTSTGWKELGKWGARNGYVSLATSGIVEAMPHLSFVQCYSSRL